MGQIKQQSKQDAYMTNLMISLLMRFPEIMSIRFDMPQDKAKFTFILQGKPEKEQYKGFTDLLKESLAAFQDLTGEVLQVKTTMQRSGKVSLLVLSSSTKSLSLEGIHLLCGLVCSSFAESVIRDADTSVDLQDDELLRQEEIIEYLLSHNTGTKKDNLLAFREAGKVFVYDK
ncbi:MAG TPA: hypothetical protein VFC74_11075 [Oscillospiraceae bacterium]|nr:hypothetical protein [Oscillospiraceae bacterium]